VEPYELSDCTLYHFDLYRLGDPEELEYMGIRDYFEDDNVCLVEWPERGAGILPLADIEVTLGSKPPGREMILRAGTARGEDILARLVSE
jgi:tRNA threonylcarbamoyladenosine biosynthesis protein TsaE